MRRSIRPARSLAAAVACGTALLLGACSSDDSASSTTTTTAKEAATTTAASGAAAAERVLFDRTIQAELRAVGCYAGAEDGEIGPETDAAIVSFQQATGITVDGELGPQTESRLKEATAAGTKVCGGTGSSTTSAVTSSTSTTAAGSARCTATAISEALAPNTVESYVCGNGWAAGSDLEGTGEAQVEAAFLLKASAGSWTRVDETQLTTVCNDPTAAGVPTAVLAVSPCKVS